MSLAKLLADKFGVSTRPIENRLPGPAGIAATPILPNDPNRLGWTIINMSANVMYLGLTQGVSAVNGIILAANGGRASAIWDEDFILVGREWWVIAAGALSNYYTLEVVEDVAIPKVAP